MIVKALLIGAAVVALILLCANTFGLVPLLFLLAFLYVFRPPKAQLTDADLDALLGRS
jgi:hypothetical protein